MESQPQNPELGIILKTFIYVITLFAKHYLSDYLCSNFTTATV